MSIKLVYVDSIFDDSMEYIGDESFRKDLLPGSAKWALSEDKNASLIFTCPCGCGAISAITVKPFAPNGWDWNGSIEKPTLQPSILRTTGCKWHGYLTDGKWVKC